VWVRKVICFLSLLTTPRRGMAGVELIMSGICCFFAMSMLKIPGTILLVGESISRCLLFTSLLVGESLYRCPLLTSCLHEMRYAAAICLLAMVRICT